MSDQKMHTPKNMTAAQAVAAVMADISKVGKDAKSGAGYTYRSIDGLINEIAPAMHRHGLILVPSVTKAEVTPMADRKGWMVAALHVDYWVYGPDGSCLGNPIKSFGLGPTNNAGTGPGIAMSYAYKIAVQQLLCVPTDDPAMNPEDLRPVQLISGDQVKELSALFKDERHAGAKAAWLAIWTPQTMRADEFLEAYVEACRLISTEAVAL